MNTKEILNFLRSYSDSQLTDNKHRQADVIVLLAGGHGSRIRSNTPKVAFELYGVPSVVRVSRACRQGLRTQHEIIIVGKQAQAVASLIGKADGRQFVYQEVQNGTGDAVKVALTAIPPHFEGNVFIFPGDAGLLDANIIAAFKKAFIKTKSNMMMLTANYEGNVENNYYGRIVRTKTDNDNDANKRAVLAIVQYQDIMRMKENDKLSHQHESKTHSFTKSELYNHREYDALMFAFQYQHLSRCIKLLNNNNAQKEYYLTDLVNIFNQQKLGVESYMCEDSKLLMGFNDKSTLKQMESVYRKKQYEKLKNIIVIKDEQQFFIDDEVVSQLIERDKVEGPLDIFVGINASISANVKIGKNVKIGDGVVLKGNITVGNNVSLGYDIKISTFSQQHVRIADNTEILGLNIIQGNVDIGKNVRIERYVNITGSDEYPVDVGEQCTLKGVTYIFGCIIEAHNWIEHSVLHQKRVECMRSKDGEIKKVRYVLPMATGMDAIGHL